MSNASQETHKYTLIHGPQLFYRYNKTKGKGKRKHFKGSSFTKNTTRIIS